MKNKKTEKEQLRKDKEFRTSEELFKNLFEKHSAVMLLIEPVSGEIINANEAASIFYGYDKSTLCKMNINEINQLPEKEIIEKRKESLAKKNNIFEFPHKLASGKIRNVQVFSSPIQYKNKIILCSIVQDITEKKQIEIELKQSDEQFKEIFNTLNEGVALNEMIFNDLQEMVNYRVLRVNEAFYFHANSNKEIAVIGSLATELYGMDTKTITSFWENHKNSTSTVTYEYISPINNKYYSISTSPFFNGKFVTTFTDITEKKNKDLLLLKNQLFLTETARLGMVGGWEFNTQTLISQWTKETYNIHEVDESFIPTVDNSLDFYTPESKPIIAQAVQKIITTGEMFNLDLEIITAKKTLRKVNAIGKPDLEHNRVYGFFQDITERKKNEERITTLLVEKELLLKEVHHRIKNNMNSIHGLLILQARALKNPAAISALEEAANRVQSMQLLYDKLYRSSDHNELSVLEYFSPLIDEIVSNFPDCSKIHIEKNIQDFIVDTKTLQPLGIIINELITNIMKYAFIDDSVGIITFTATLQNNTILIIIEDNGNGIPESVSFENSKGFGLFLVNALTQQLGGSIKIIRERGTKIILELPFLNDTQY